MAQIKADRVKEATETTGTGNIALAGASLGYRAFSSVMSVNDTCYYVLAHKSSGEWETGFGTLLNATTFARSSVSASSNANTWVNFSSGTKELSLALTTRQLDHIPQVSNGIPQKLKYDEQGWIYSDYYETQLGISFLHVYGKNLFTGMPNASPTGIRHSGLAIGKDIMSLGNGTFFSESICIGSDIQQGGHQVLSSVLIGQQIAVNGTGNANSVVAIGIAAHYSIGAGAYRNVAIGSGSCVSLGVDDNGTEYTTIDNISIGYYSLLDCFNGNYNVAVGAYAGSFGQTLTKCVFVGYNAKCLNTTETNSIVIGSDSTSKGSNTTVIGNSSTTEAWIYGKLIPSGAIQPASISDASAPNNSLYYSTTASKLVFKDSGGNVNNLY